MDQPFILAVVADLFFTAKILDAAKRAGLRAEFTPNRERALARALERPRMIVIDLNHAAANPVGLISELKAAQETRDIPLLGFLSHIQVDLKKKAEEAGCDRVLPRSAFSERLPQILEAALTSESSLD